jgi:copper chaperone
MHCGHCQDAVAKAVSGVQGVSEVTVDLDSKLVTVMGQDLDDAELRAAIDEAGYEVTSA